MKCKDQLRYEVELNNIDGNHLDVYLSILKSNHTLKQTEIRFYETNQKNAERYKRINNYHKPIPKFLLSIKKSRVPVIIQSETMDDLLQQLKLLKLDDIEKEIK